MRQTGGRPQGGVERERGRSRFLVQAAPPRPEVGPVVVGASAGHTFPTSHHSGSGLLIAPRMLAGNNSSMNGDGKPRGHISVWCRVCQSRTRCRWCVCHEALAPPEVGAFLIHLVHSRAFFTALRGTYYPSLAPLSVSLHSFQIRNICRTLQASALKGMTSTTPT